MQKTHYTLLYIEDELATRSNIAKFLATRCAEVFEASDGEEGYKLYKKHLPDFIITDLQTPKLDGISLIQKIRSYDYTTPIIIISAYSDKEKLSYLQSYNILSYIIKPITRTGLKDMLDLVFSKLDEIRK